jgi:hypothetical protein
LLNHGWLGEHIEDGGVFVGELDPVLDDRRHVADHGLKAMHLNQ